MADTTLEMAKRAIRLNDNGLDYVCAAEVYFDCLLRVENRRYWVYPTCLYT